MTATIRISPERVSGDHFFEPDEEGQGARSIFASADSDNLMPILHRIEDFE